MTSIQLLPPRRAIAAVDRLILAWALMIVAPLSQAALTGLADEPLITQPEFKPKPNLMVILDDSGSMDRAYMPDDAAYQTNRFGLYAPQCNGVAYDPAISYTPPLKPDGTPYANASFTNALANGFDSASDAANLTDDTRALRITTDAAVSVTATSFVVQSREATALGPGTFPAGIKITLTDGGRTIAGTVDTWTYNAQTDKGVLTLKSITKASGGGTSSSWTASFSGQHYFLYRGTEPKMGYAYDATGALQSNAFLNQCNLVRTSARNSDNGNVFVFNVITAESSAAVKTNYANWYSYYRTRRLLMRSAMGQAVNPLDENYRIGFMTINKRGAAGSSSDSFRPVNDFGAAQKSDFFGSLYAASGNSTTPLRTALSHAGRYFAKDLANQRTDPMQYACQRNYALLTTDGYWNETFTKGGLGDANIGDADGDRAATYESNKSTGNTTLADVAHYYYHTDLRSAARNNCTGAPVGGNPGQDVCANIITPAGNDDAVHQHMTTFTIGLGIVGTLPQTSTPSAWPSMISNDAITTADDLWHASLNGRGAHYSAQNATQLSDAIKGIVTAIQDVTGAGSATSTSTLDLVQGDGNIAFEASYTTGSWYGDVVAREMDPVTALPREGAPKWSAKEQLASVAAASRKIYFSSGTSLVAFSWDNLSDAQKANFQNACSASPARMTQCATLSDDRKTALNSGINLVNYLRGDQTLEALSPSGRVYRERKAKLGDIINSKPVHVGKPPFDYGDAGYAEFKSTHANRKKVVYVGANDGMLHALDAATGAELWAYIPTSVMPQLYKLADVKYGSNPSQPHTYYVDGKAVQGDVKIGGVWKTILVGGLNKGGRAYYALDVTDPDAPKALWEFAHDASTVHNNLGLSYSDPVISKLGDGTWTVAFGSGYNKVSPGDGKGRLYVVNAGTGAIERNIVTSEGTATTPSGLSKINVWRKAPTDNTAERYYAGDLQGNLWRFDIDGLVEPHQSALRLAQMESAGGMPLPITTEPKLREYERQPLIAVATGRYLGRDDIDDTRVQSIAAIRDPLTATGWGVVRSSTRFKKVTIQKSGAAAGGEAVTVDWLNDGGWWADFPTAGERVALPMEWDGARLLAATTLPDGNQCKSGGSSWLYTFGLAGGKTNGEQFSDSALIVGFSVVTNAEGKPKILVRTSNGKTVVKDGTGIGGASTIKRARRISWRELN